jgi:hypothetical protein
MYDRASRIDLQHQPAGGGAFDLFRETAIPFHYVG